MSESVDNYGAEALTSHVARYGHLPQTQEEFKDAIYGALIRSRFSDNPGMTYSVLASLQTLTKQDADVIAHHILHLRPVMEAWFETTDAS
jgi:hypothetical protein